MDYFSLRSIKSSIHSLFGSGEADAGVGRTWVPGHEGPRVPLFVSPSLYSNPLVWTARCRGSHTCPHLEGLSHLCEAAHQRSPPAPFWSLGTKWAAWWCFEHFFFLTPGHSFLGQLQVIVHFLKICLYSTFFFSNHAQWDCSSAKKYTMNQINIIQTFQIWTWTVSHY